MKSVKNIIKFLPATALVAVGLNSCSLDVEPKTETNTGSFYRTEAQMMSALNGCYSAWERTSSDDTWGFYIVSELMADECLAGTGVSDKADYAVVDRFDINQYSAGTSLLDTSWNAYYRCIYRCNEVIGREEQVEWSNEATRNTLIGEAHALRALCYFDMVRMWENVPLLLEATENVNVPQAAPDETYEAIISDLKFAAANIPADAYPKANMMSNEGHITRYAAEGMLARVYLFYTGYYGHEHPSLTKAEAVGYLDEIIRSNEYELLDNFADLWPAASSVSLPDAHEWDPSLTTYQKTNREVLLQMQFNYVSEPYNDNTPDDKNGNRWLTMLGLRKINASPYAYGWGCCTVNPRTFRAFDETDPRRTASIIDMDGEGILSKPGIDSREYLRDQKEYTGYAVKKYTPTCYADGTSSVPDHATTSAVQEYQTQPFIILRYSDVLLMAAELGGTPALDAKGCLDKVRFRAGLPGIPATYENIMSERQSEFAFEAIRYWDLLRRGVDYAANTIAENTTVLTGGSQVQYSVSAQNIIAKRGLMQIPQNQITLSNGVLKQNPGW